MHVNDNANSKHGIDYYSKPMSGDLTREVKNGDSVPPKKNNSNSRYIAVQDEKLVREVGADDGDYSEIWSRAAVVVLNVGRMTPHCANRSRDFTDCCRIFDGCGGDKAV